MRITWTTPGGWQSILSSWLPGTSFGTESTAQRLECLPIRVHERSRRESFEAKTQRLPEKSFSPLLWGRLARPACRGRSTDRIGSRGELFNQHFSGGKDLDLFPRYALLRFN